MELFWDAGHQASFDHKGRKRLAKSLAENTFKLMRLHRALEDQRYLGKRDCSAAQSQEDAETEHTGQETIDQSKTGTATAEAKTWRKSTAWGGDTWQPGASLDQDRQL